jgi:L-ribulose-5-phosphate 3-epimerase UlaE
MSCNREQPGAHAQEQSADMPIDCDDRDARQARLEWMDSEMNSDTRAVAHRTATPNLLARTVAFERLP